MKKFLTQDIFKGYKWNRISRSDRFLGTLFLNYIKMGDVGVIQI
ncbi:DUF1413 domain-containing protein [Sedimentibacter sp.]|nr:DUF1413 domain-containing protein [Sedimentibacter sp.]